MKVRLHGVFPPIPTPFVPGGDVDQARLAENLRRWNDYDLSGYVVLGSNGEVVYLDTREKIRVWETARETIPSDKVMVAGTGCESARETLALTRQATDVGADAALIATPHYYGGKMTDEALTRYYQTVADNSPIPIVLYNVPKFTHVDMSSELVARLARHSNIVGVKDSGGNLAKLADVVRLTGPDFQVLAGSAGFFLAGLMLGAVGGVMALANVAPQQSIEIYRLFRAERWEEAVKLQRRMVPVNAAVTARFGIAGLKAALDMLGYYGGPVRAPLLDLSESELGTLRAILVGGGVL